MTAPLDHAIPEDTSPRRKWRKWVVIVAVAAVVGFLLWFYVFPYVTTLLPENF